MGTAGQHFEWFDSILGRVREVTTHNHSLRVQYERYYHDEFNIDYQVTNMTMYYH